MEKIKEVISDAKIRKALIHSLSVHEIMGTFTKETRDGLNGISHFLESDPRRELELELCVPVFLQDPMTALKNPELGVQGIWVRYEQGLSDGPTSARVAVVDYIGDCKKLISPIRWDEDQKWFKYPADDGTQADKLLLADFRLPDSLGDDLLEGPESDEEKAKYEEEKAKYKEFIDAVVKNPYYHQLNVWAIVERVVEFFEDSKAMGRPLPWGFDGNRLLVVPHAGYGENAYYDRNSKSLQFYYYGDESTPSFTCLFHDVITHETGHAALDGIRPLYNQQLTSAQTNAFHEYMGDITAILISFFNRDIRAFLARSYSNPANAQFNFDVLARLAEQFGEEVEGREYLRSAKETITMESEEIRGCLSPHKLSTVLTSTMFEIAMGYFVKHMEKNKLKARKKKKVTTPNALWWTADRFRRIVLQPLDYCPPCDIQFLDYARAVIRHDMLTNPADKQNYQPMMLDIFHRRGFCDCGYDSQKSDAEISPKCKFLDVLEGDLPEIKCYEIGHVSRSRTAAYYFINQHRDLLCIPRCQDFVITDLYETKKMGVADNSLPAEYVIEYVWQEEVLLENERGVNFKEWAGKKISMDCGGTLVYDGSGNLLSWFHKPGTEFFKQPDIQKKMVNPNKYEKWEKIKAACHEADDRIWEHKKYIAQLIKKNLIGSPQPDNAFVDVLKPVVAVEDQGVVHFESIPHVRKSEFRKEEDRWEIDY